MSKVKVTDVSVISGEEIGEFLNSGEASKAIEMLRQQLVDVEPKKQISASYNGIEISQVEDPQTLVEIHYHAQSEYPKYESSRDFLSKAVGTTIPSKEWDSFEIVEEAIIARLSKLMNKARIEKIKECISLMEKFVTEEEKKKAEKNQARQRLLELLG